jgi:hypothetical protein
MFRLEPNAAQRAQKHYDAADPKPSGSRRIGAPLEGLVASFDNYFARTK